MKQFTPWLNTEEDMQLKMIKRFMMATVSSLYGYVAPVLIACVAFTPAVAQADSLLRKVDQEAADHRVDIDGLLGEWRAATSSMDVTGVARMTISKDADGVVLKLVGPENLDFGFTTNHASFVNGALETTYSHFEPHFGSYMAPPVRASVARDRNKPHLSATFRDVVGRELQLDFFPATDPRFDLYDAPQLNPNGSRKTQYQYAPPEAADGDFPVSTLRAEDVDQAAIEAGVDQLLHGQEYPHSAFLLIVRNGKLILEEYFHGANKERLWKMASVSKSLTSLLLGVASADGALDVDQPINPMFPEFSETEWMRSSTEQGVTPRRLLYMANVIGWGDDDYLEPNGRFGQMMSHPKGWLAGIFSYPVIAANPGPFFQYNTGLTNILGVVLERGAGVHPALYLQEKLMTPLDEERSFFGSFPSGVPSNENASVLAGGTAYLRPMAMAKIGQMMLDGGRWKGRPVVPSSWVTQSASVQAVTPVMSKDGYGYQWWIFKLNASGRKKPVWMVAALGFGGQTILVLPEYDLVVVTGAQDYEGGTKRRRDFVFKHILPAVADGDTFSYDIIEGDDIGTPVLR